MCVCVSVLQCNMPMYPFHLFRTRAKKAPNTPNTKMAGWAGLGVIVPGNRVQGAGNLFLGRIGRYSTVPDELDLGGATAIHVPGTLGLCT